MSLSYSCEAAEHSHCLRRSCTCACHETAADRAADEAARRTLERVQRRRPGRVPASAKRAEGALTPRTRPGPTSVSAPGRPAIDLPADTIAAAYQAGDTLDQLAADHGVSIPTIRQRLVDAGVEIRRPGPQYR